MQLKLDNNSNYHPTKKELHNDHKSGGFSFPLHNDTLRVHAILPFLLLWMLHIVLYLSMIAP